MKTILKSAAVAFVGFISFSFTTIDDNNPKVVIVDIVDNIETTNDNNLTKDFRESIDSLNQTEKVKILDWKDITKGLDEQNKQALLDSIKPEVVLTLNFKNAKDGNNAVTAVVSKDNKHFDNSLQTAKKLTSALESSTIKNEGVFQAESEYVQDNIAPAMFVSIETVNDNASNTTIVNTLSKFIEEVEVNATPVAEESLTIETTQD